MNILFKNKCVIFKDFRRALQKFGNYISKEKNVMSKNTTKGVPLKIFISSTYEDMIEYRKVVISDATTN